MDEPELADVLEDMKMAALAAGKIANHYRNNPHAVSVELKKEAGQKHGSTPTPVSIADKEIETSVFSELRRKHPDFAFLGEESYNEDRSYQSARYSIIVDPIDGTRAFVESIGVVSSAQMDGILRQLGTRDMGSLKARSGNDYYFDKACAAPLEYGVTVWGLGAYLEEMEIDTANASQRFMKRVSEQAIHIGLAKEGKSIAGVVYMPMADRLYHAMAGAGAYVNGERIHVSNSSAIDAQRLILGRYNIGSDKLEDMQMENIVRRLPFIDRENITFSSEKLYKNPSFLRNVNLEGSFGVKICHVAEGIYETFLHTDGMPGLWDICAPEAILNEAGGKATDINGNPFDYRALSPKLQHGTLATNGVLHEDNLRVIRGRGKEVL